MKDTTQLHERQLAAEKLGFKAVANWPGSQDMPSGYLYELLTADDQAIILDLGYRDVVAEIVSVKTVMCEDCDRIIRLDNNAIIEDGRTFCSDDCATEFKDKQRCAAMDDAREREVWGDDFNSWYR